MPRKIITKDSTTTDVVEKMRQGNCNVYYEKSITKNLGNYESAKITVGATLPINPTAEELKMVQKTFEQADVVITKELELQLKDLTKDR